MKTKEQNGMRKVKVWDLEHWALLTGKRTELADVSMRQKVSTAYVQEAFSMSSSNRRNGIFLHSNWKDKVVEVARKSDRLAIVKLVTDKAVPHVTIPHGHICTTGRDEQGE